MNVIENDTVISEQQQQQQQQKRVKKPNYVPENTFTYENSIYPRNNNVDWDTDVDNLPDPIPYENTKRCIRSVTFPISRCWNVNRTIRFRTPVTKKEAVEAAEAFLSQPFTRPLFAKIKQGNWMCSDMTFKHVVAKKLCIGDLLGGAVFMEGFDTDAKGHTKLVIGS